MLPSLESPASYPIPTRPGIIYGVGFVADRHHPAVVHSEYAVIVLSVEDGDANKQMRVWSDIHCNTLWRCCEGITSS
ncbi:putative tRNA-intron lyase [Rosa chinensis]|uniref:Putative tRNA-intron lyase n=1 Tax=Rosa chinensis TaxID=74649 RepID=A0A2P6Q8K1_ROSCH|nr:putative tRNA-intron lyase [Rosa chinensis]